MPLQLRLATFGSAGSGASLLIERLLEATTIDAPSIEIVRLDGTSAFSANPPTADAALLLIDARSGVLPETLHHALLAELSGLSHRIVVIDGMDLVEYAEARLRAIERDCLEVARRLGDPGLAIIPVSAERGENLAARGTRMPWYAGPTLLERLTAIEQTSARAATLPFRMQVQSVSRSGEIHGTIVSGVARPGARIRVQPSGQMCTIVHIATPAGALPDAGPGQAVTLELGEAAEVAAGDLLAQAEAPAGVADQFEATILWTAEQPMLGGRPYGMRIAGQAAVATLAAPKYRIDPGTLEHLAARKLERGEVGVCNLSLDRPVAFDPFRDNRDTGSFGLLDRLNGETVGSGRIHFALRRADNIHVQAVDVDRAARARLKGQLPCVVWLTGLSGAGKSTIANLLDRRLHAMGRHTYLMDGDNVRHGLNRDLGFTAADRVENVRRVAEVAKLMADAGLIVIVSLISPFRSERRMARELMKPGEFIEVFVDAPLQVAEQRDPKGLYKKARRGELKNFTGIDSPYETPERPEVHVDTSVAAAEDCVERVLACVEQNRAR